MPARDDLHKLIDTLPEGALENAHRMLEHMQVWPPPRPPGWERIEETRRRHEERFQLSRRPGTTGGFSAGGGLSQGHGHTSSTHWEDQTAVIQTWRYHKGHELNIVEKLRVEEDGKALVYVHEVTGPKDVSHRHEMTFELA